MKRVWKFNLLFVMLMVMLIFCANAEAAVPTYTYSGSSSTSTDTTYWYIYFTSTGKFRLTGVSPNIDVFLVGGGGGGAYNEGGGGGGGYTQTYRNISLTAGTEYSVTVGAGGAAGTSASVNGGTGGTSYFENYSALGGNGANGKSGGNGGSGGGGSGYQAGNGGSDGGNGGNGLGAENGGAGQGATTRAFGESSGTLYAGGGGGGSYSAEASLIGYGGSGGGGNGAYSIPENKYNGIPGAGAANTGGGGGGGDDWTVGAAGGTGIVIIRGINCTSHTGGTHANGGKCTTCGVVYQIHSQSNVVANYTSTSTQHTPNYACTLSGCSSTYTGTAVNHSGATHNNGGKCTACEYVYETHSQGVAIVDYSTTSTQHTPNYACTLNGCTGKYAGATELHSGGGTNDGYCIVCGVQYQTHGQSGNIWAYKQTETQHIPAYECNLSGCEQLYLGTAENHNGATHENGGKCAVCGYLYELHEQSTTVVSYTQQENGHNPVYSCTAIGCASTYTGDMELHDGTIELHIADSTCASCGWVESGESDGNTYVLNINYDGDVTTRNVQSGHLVTFGVSDRSDAIYTVDTGNTVLRVYGNRRQFYMPSGDVVITINDVN